MAMLVISTSWLGSYCHLSALSDTGIHVTQAAVRWQTLHSCGHVTHISMFHFYQLQATEWDSQNKMVVRELTRIPTSSPARVSFSCLLQTWLISVLATLPQSILQASRPRNSGLIPESGKTLFAIPNNPYQLQTPPSLTFSVFRGALPAGV